MKDDTKDSPQASDGQSLSDEMSRLMRQSQWAQAIELALSQGNAQIQDHDVCWNVGWAYFKLGQLAEAKRFLIQAIGILRTPSIIWALGVVEMKLGQLDAAEENFRESLALREGSLARADLALVLMEQGRRSEAEEAHLEGIRLRPESQAGRLDYTVFLIDEGRMNDARRTYEAAELLPVRGRYKRDRDALLALAGMDVKSTLSGAPCVASPEVRWSGFPISISHEGRLDAFPDGVGAAERILPDGYLHRSDQTWGETRDMITSFFRSTTDELAYFIDWGGSVCNQSPAFKVPFKWGVSNVEALVRMRSQGIALVGGSFENGLVLRPVPDRGRETARFGVGCWTCRSPEWKSSLYASMAGSDESKQR